MHALQFWMDMWPYISPYITSVIPYIRPTSAMVGDPSNYTLKFILVFKELVTYQYYLVAIVPKKKRKARERLLVKCPDVRVTISMVQMNV